MVVTISPLELALDVENPRFVILASREQADIRKYLVTYEDVCQLATAINEYGSLLPGERIVVLRENDKYVVVEGNRRTCSLQFLLSRDLIPEGFAHRIPHTSAAVIEKCSNIEVDVLPDRNSALELMTKRHIQGVKQWKPLAKKQFFSANYQDGRGQSVQDLSRITGIREGEIKDDIRDYKFFSDVYTKYASNHPEFDREIIVLKTDPFWRIFKAKFEYPIGHRISPKDFLQISYDDTFNTISSLPPTLFEQITQLVFEQTIVEEAVTTRNVLTDVDGIMPLLQAVADCTTDEEENGPAPTTEHAPDDEESSTPEAGQDGSGPIPPRDSGGETNSGSGSDGLSGGPRPGGPAPRSFFETISWRGKLSPSNPLHQGLLYAINELYGLSSQNCSRQKAYCTFPIATGMVLRTVYEQALRLRLNQVGLWGTYMERIDRGLPTLSSMECFICAGANKSVVFPDQGLLLAYDRVIAATHREFLNANIHYPGNINVTADSLEAIAAGGMFSVIQGIINLL